MKGAPIGVSGILVFSGGKGPRSNTLNHVENANAFCVLCTVRFIYIIRTPAI